MRIDAEIGIDTAENGPRRFAVDQGSQALIWDRFCSSFACIWAVRGPSPNRRRPRQARRSQQSSAFFSPSLASVFASKARRKPADGKIEKRPIVALCLSPEFCFCEVVQLQTPPNLFRQERGDTDSRAQTSAGGRKIVLCDFF